MTINDLTFHEQVAFAHLREEYEKTHLPYFHWFISKIIYNEEKEWFEIYLLTDGSPIKKDHWTYHIPMRCIKEKEREIYGH